MKKFVSGVVAGTTLTVATIAGLMYGVKKTVIDPMEEKENEVIENRRKAMRKSRAR
ncbi:DUF3042 family protein [Vagococcus sp. PNs007]|uniref:DUF3042 domain-containing protein n=2 Tax=Vagococcus TaxID=2737 RepID=A0A430A7P9_9ENTE|nr:MULTISPECIES: DUF3042 family protein [Vagococcus]MDF0479500.1 DUF3042 family protein [Vagococcus proximus]RSU03130.1 DUF3042 domain-containing protein [Vagococcus fessus]